VQDVAVDVDGDVYCVGNDNAVRRLAAATGAQIWSSVGYASTTHCVAVDVEKNLYFGTADLLYKFDASGTLVRSVDIGDGVLSLAISPSGNIYIGSGDGNVYKYDAEGNRVWMFSGHASAVTGVANIGALKAAGFDV